MTMHFKDLSLVSALLSLCLAYLSYQIVEWAYNVLWRKQRGLPDGPWGYPIVGSMFSLGKCPLKTYSKWSKIYGDIFSMNICGTNIVVINNYKPIHQTLVKMAKKFAGRPHLYLMDILLPKTSIGGGDNTEQMRNFRHLTLQTFRELGIGKSIYEEKVLAETQKLINYLKLKADNAIDLAEPLAISILNNTTNILLGKQFDYEDESLLDLQKNMGIMMHMFKGAGIENFFPITRWLPNNWKLLAANRNANNLVNGWVDEYKSSNELQKENSFLKKYFQDVEKGKMPDYGDDIIKAVIFNLVVGGFETTSNTLKWAIIFMIQNPDIQQKVAEELDSIDLLDGSLMARKSSLPLTQATIHEVERMSSLLTYRATTEDVFMDGYTIPKDTLVIANLHSSMFDPNTWPEPTKFDPNRFLDADGENVISRPELIPFGLGSRNCVGEALAKLELLIYFSHLLKAFTFRYQNDTDSYTVEDGILGLTMVTPPFKVVIKRRN